MGKETRGSYCNPNPSRSVVLYMYSVLSRAFYIVAQFDSDVVRLRPRISKYVVTLTRYLREHTLMGKSKPKVRASVYLERRQLNNETNHPVFIGPEGFLKVP